MLLYGLRKLKNHGHVSETYVIATDSYRLLEAQMVDGAAKVITGQSNSGLTVRMRKSMIYGEVMKADLLGESEMKTVGAARLTASTAKSTIVARTTTRTDSTSAGIGITIAPTADAMTMTYISTAGAARGIIGKVDHGIDLDHARNN